MTSSDAVPPGNFTGFAESQSEALLRLAYVLTGQRESAEDLVQETLRASPHLKVSYGVETRAEDR